MKKVTQNLGNDVNAATAFDAFTKTWGVKLWDWDHGCFVTIPHARLAEFVKDRNNDPLPNTQHKFYKRRITSMTSVTPPAATNDRKAKTTTTSAVSSPLHYTVGGIETIDYLRAKLSPEEFRGFCRGNVLKYVSRAAYKNGIEDLEKAAWYLAQLIALTKDTNSDTEEQNAHDEFQNEFQKQLEVKYRRAFRKWNGNGSKP